MIALAVCLFIVAGFTGWNVWRLLSIRRLIASLPAEDKLTRLNLILCVNQIEAELRLLAVASLSLGVMPWI